MLADPVALVRLLFPEQAWTRQQNVCTGEDGSRWFIESLTPGSFTGDGRDEILLALRPGDSPGHAAGFYQLRLAIFDNASRQLAAAVHDFAADDGIFRVFSGQSRSYVFMAGGTTYQGWTTWQGGLWQAGQEWRLVWPRLANGQTAEAWWQDRAVRFRQNGIELLDRQVLPRTVPDQLIPEFTWVPVQVLEWDPGPSTFAE